MSIDAALAERLYLRAEAGRWQVSVAEFTAVLERCAAKIDAAEPKALSRALEALHVEDLALATACAQGREAAWDHFVLEFRPTLYRAARAIAGEDGRELADSLYGELFGLKEREGERQSLFRYFHGRSSLATWLRAIIAQRQVDGVRSRRRFEPLPETDDPASPVAAPVAGEESQALGARVRDALASALARLTPRDRLRLGWYYAQSLTLADIGRLCQEHEATVSRHLNRTRKSLRADVEAQLREAGLTTRAIDEAFAAAAVDPGDADLGVLLATDESRKNPGVVRSRIEERS